MRRQSSWGLARANSTLPRLPSCHGMSHTYRGLQFTFENLEPGVEVACRVHAQSGSGHVGKIVSSEKAVVGRATVLKDVVEQWNESQQAITAEVHKFKQETDAVMMWASAAGEAPFLAELGRRALQTQLALAAVRVTKDESGVDAELQQQLQLQDRASARTRIMKLVDLTNVDIAELDPLRAAVARCQQALELAVAADFFPEEIAALETLAATFGKAQAIREQGAYVDYICDEIFLDSFMSAMRGSVALAVIESVSQKEMIMQVNTEWGDVSPPVEALRAALKTLRQSRYQLQLAVQAARSAEATADEVAGFEEKLAAVTAQVSKCERQECVALMSNQAVTGVLEVGLHNTSQKLAPSTS